MSTSTPSDLTASISPLRFRQAIEQAKPFMAALRPDELMDINLDIPTATVAILAYGDSQPLKELRAQAAVELPKFDLANFDMLVTWALATAQAHTELMSATRNVNYQEWVTASEQARDLLKSEIQLLAKRGLIDASRLSELRGPVGHKNLAFDVLVCCNTLRSHWDAIKGRTTTTLQEIERAEQTADKLATAVGMRDMGPMPLSAEADQRRRAFTLMARAHDQVRRAATYLVWSQGEVDRLVPSLYLNNNEPRSAKSKSEAEANAEQPAPVADPIVAPPAGNGAAAGATNGGSNGAPNGNGAKPAAGNGMAGSDPFGG